MTTTIKSNGIEFEPFIWNFGCDGMWGRIFFLVPKGTFSPGMNNGAYADDSPRYPTTEFICPYAQDKYQLVYAAISCVPIKGNEAGDNCEQYELKDMLQATADWIAHNLTIVDNTHRFRSIKELSDPR
jgi:hypothetical protein